MNLCRCERGHFYDKEKYSSCPHCAGGSASDDKLTMAFTETVTVPMDRTEPEPEMMMRRPQASAEPPVMGNPVPFTAPSMNSAPLPIAGMPVDQPTIPVSVADQPTVPLTMTIPEPDDDHTVGFFADVFPGTESKEGKTVRLQTVNKVDTPCVGWLIALGGEHLGTDFRLKVGKNFIGRDAKMDVALTEDKSVSRDRHAIVVYEPKAHLYLIQPGESSSLVYRNNEVVLTPVKLEAYDMITVGDVNLLFMPLCGERFNWGDLLEELKKKNNEKNG